jgi:hypothetical protein
MPPEPFVPPADEYEDMPEHVEDESRDAGAVDQTPSATDAKAQARAKHLRKLNEKKVAEFWSKRVLNDEVGRGVVWGMLASLDTFRTSVPVGPGGLANPEAAWFQYGQRQAGMGIFLTAMKQDYMATHQMLVEHHPDFALPKPVRRKKNDV